MQDFTLCLQIQNPVLPENRIQRYKEINGYGTSTGNEPFRAFRKLSANYEDVKTKRG